MASSSPYPDSAVVFAFLVILLGGFAVFLVGGLTWSYARSRRRAWVAAAIAVRAFNIQWADGMPVMWEVCIGKEGKVDKPLACRPYAHSAPSTSRTTTNEDPLMYTPDVSLWELIKFTFRTARWPWQPSERPVHPAKSISSEPEGDIEAQLKVLREVEVSMLITMPRPKGEVAQGLEECVLGTMRTAIRLDT